MWLRFDRTKVNEPMVHGFDPTRDALAKALVRKQAFRLKRHSYFAEEDEHDLQQELMLKLWQVRNQYRAEYGHWHAYVRAVLRTHASNMLRHRKAQVRNAGEIIKFSTPIDVDVGCKTEVGDTVTDGRLDARLGRERRRDTELSALRSDLIVVLARLPPRQREALELLKQMEKREVAERMQIAISTLNGWIRNIRFELTQSGVRNYMFISNEHRK